MRPRNVAFASGIFLVMSVFVAVPAGGENASQVELNLSRSLQIADEQNPGILLSRERIVQAVERIAQRASDFWPQIDANVSQSRMTRDLRGSGIQLGGEPKIGPFNAFDAGLELNLLIFDAEVITRLKSARIHRDVSEADFKKVRQDVLALTAELYFNAKRAFQKVNYTRESFKRDVRKMSTAYRQYALGVISSLEKEKVRALYAGSQAQLHSALVAAEEHRLNLLSALGFSPLTVISYIDEELPLEAILGLLSPSPSQESLPDVDVAHQILQEQNSERSEVRNSYWPKISAVGDYGTSGSGPSSGEFSETYSLGVKASFPVFEGTKRFDQLREADSKIREAQITLEDTRLRSGSRIMKARRGIERAQRVLNEKASQLTVARKAVSVAYRQRALGVIDDDSLKVFKADLAYAIDQDGLAQAGYYLAVVNLAHAQGEMEIFLP